MYKADRISSSSTLRKAANNLISHFCKDPIRAWHILNQTISSFGVLLGDQDCRKFYL